MNPIHLTSDQLHALSELAKEARRDFPKGSLPWEATSATDRVVIFPDRIEITHHEYSIVEP